MTPTKQYHQLANIESIEKTMVSLEKNGIRAFLVKNKDDAKKKVMEFIPHQSEIMTTSSTTLAETGIDVSINDSIEYKSVRKQLMNNQLEKMEKRRIGGAPEWVIGSVHAITEDGEIIVASATGSQIPSYVYGATNVLWIVGTQKIVKDLTTGMDRVYMYAFPLENERSMRVYGTESGVNKILIINKETIPGRIHIIFVNEVLGF